MDDIFLQCLENIYELYTKKLPKGKLIGKYMELLNKANKENAFRYKHPQIVGNSDNPSNNWLDYILSLSQEEFNYFKESLVD